MRHDAVQISLFLSILATVTGLLVAQTVPDQKPSFEVASIKRNLSGQEGGGGGPRADRFAVKNVPFRTLVFMAFRRANNTFHDQQIIGGPEWTRTDRFDVEAKMPGTPPVPYERMQLMLQSLLEDRFQLKAHRETRDLSVYELVVANGGVKMQVSKDQTAPDPRQVTLDFNTSDEEDPKPLPRGSTRLTTGTTDTILSASAVPVSIIVRLLQSPSDRIIIDKTNLSELFDIHVRFRRDSADSTSPSLFTALQELGLKLESGKAPLEVVVIDSVQKPSEN